MANEEARRFACNNCGKEYRWKSEIAGRKVKCTNCGTVIIAAAPAGEDEALYDLAPDDEPLITRTSIHVPSPVASEEQVAEPPATSPARLRPLAYRSPNADTCFDATSDPNPVRDLYMPLWLLGGSIAILTVAMLLRVKFDAAGGRGFFVALSAMGAQIIVGTLLMLAGIWIAAKTRGMNLGPVPIAMLKLSAISVAPDALTTLTGPVLRLIPIVGGILNWALGFLIYFGLIGALFDLDESDTWWCVIIIFFIKLAVAVALLYSGVLQV